MKKIKFLTIFATMSTMGASLIPLASCNKNTVAVEGVDFDEYYAYVKEGETKEKAPITIYPENASDKQVKWRVDDPEIATVDDNGNIKGIKEGTTYLTVITRNNGKSSYIPLYVYKEYVPVTKLTLNTRAANMVKGQEMFLKAKIEPENASIQNVKWSVDDEDVCEIDSITGKVTAVSEGGTIVTCTSLDNLNIYESAYISVSNEEIKVTAFTPVCDNIKMSIGQTTYAPYTVTPENASTRIAVLTSSDEKIVTVDEYGCLTAVANGTATITISNRDKTVTSTFTVTVADLEKHVESIAISDKTLNIKSEEQKDLTVTVNPTDASFNNVWWYSADESVAKVDQKTGKVTGVYSGTTTIYAISLDGMKTDECEVTVYQPVSKISLIPLAYLDTNMTLLNSIDLSNFLTVKPFDATNREVVWSSTKPDVAVVDQEGVVTAKTTGNAMIYATSKENPEISGWCEVIVGSFVPVESITLSDKHVSLSADEPSPKDITVTAIEPASPTSDRLYWEIDNESVADISVSDDYKTCTITPKKGGRATITVTALGGLAQAKCTIEVTRRLQSLKIDDKSKKALNGIVETKQTNLLYSYEPSDCTELTSIKWTSSDPTIGTITNWNQFNALKTGKTTVSVSNAEGTIKDEVEATVNPFIHVESVKFKESQVLVESGTQKKVDVIIEPSNATDKRIHFTSSNAKIASVNWEDPIITGKQVGDAIITATSVDGEKQSQVNVTVPLSFASDTWENLINIASQGLDKLREYYKVDNFVGLRRHLCINGQMHKVVVADVQHDTTKDDQKATFTFALENLLSDTDGYTLLSIFDASANNKDFINSTLNCNLNGGAHKKFKTSVIELIAQEEPVLATGIKDVKKDALIYNEQTGKWETQIYQTKLFPLSATEMNRKPTGQTDVGTTYAYYQTLKKEDAIVYNSVSGGSGWYWLRTPDLTKTNFSHTYQIDYSGKINSQNVVNVFDRVIFAFCI